MEKIWRLIIDGALEPMANMAIDEAIMESLAEEDALPTLRFYRWLYPCISMGRFQDPLTLPSPLRGEGESLPVVRRPTGGGSVFHNRNSITYSILYKEDSGAIPKGLSNSYREIHMGVLDALREFGMDAELYLAGAKDVNPVRELRPLTVCSVDHRLKSVAFSNGVKTVFGKSCFSWPVEFDVVCGGKKVAGAAQRRRYGVVLHQGEVSLELDVWSRWSYNALVDVFKRNFSRRWRAKFVKSRFSRKEKMLAAVIKKRMEKEYRDWT